LLPQEAQNDVLSFVEAGVFSPAQDGVNWFLANMMVVLRTSGKELRTSNKADAHIERQKSETEKNVNKNDHDHVKQEPQRWRSSIDFRLINKCNKSPTVISLPSLLAVESKIRDSHVSLLDLSSQFYTVRLAEKSKQFFNFYFQDQLLL
jgi:hypothetical protein